MRFNGVDVQVLGGLAWVDYSLVGASCVGCGSVGNPDGDPGFWNLAGGDFYLRPGSPCIDAGDPASPSDPDGSRVHLGALTYDPTCPSSCSPAA